MRSPPRIASAQSRRLIAASTVALLCRGSHGAVAHGSGVLLRTTQRFFVATAAHLFGPRLRLQRLAIAGRGRAAPLPLGAATLHADGGRLDFALIELQGAGTIARLERERCFTPLERILDCPDDGSFLLAGYPYEFARHADAIDAGLFLLDTWRIEVPANAAAPVDPAVDLFFACGDSGAARDGRGVRTPALEGASGAGVWLVDAAGAPRLVGIQCAFRPGQYFRASGCTAALAALAREVPAVATGLDIMLRPGPCR